MMIQLTNEQWADVSRQIDLPIRVSDPSQRQSFVLVPSDVYEQFRALFEDVPLTEQERQFHLQQFGKRAGWDDPEMDVYDELDPRRKS